MMYLFGVIVQVNYDHQIARPHLRNTLQSPLARAPASEKAPSKCSWPLRRQWRQTLCMKQTKNLKRGRKRCRRKKGRREKRKRIGEKEEEEERSSSIVIPGLSGV